MKKRKNNLHIYLLAIILGIAIFMRFYNFPLRYSLGEETVRDAVIGIEGARQLQFPLTGSFSSLGPFTFGPWYAYQLIFFYFLIPHVYSPWIYLSLISVLYVFILFKIGDLLGGKTFGLILAFLAAISPAQVISANHLTSHNNTHLFAALAIWIFLKILVKDISYWWGFSLGMAIGIGMNLHFQMSGLLILPLILLIYKRKKYKYFLTSAGGVVASFLPMFFFEANNHWFTTRNILQYLMHDRYRIYVPNSWTLYVQDFWPSFWGDVIGVPVWMAWILMIGFVCCFALAFYKKKLSSAFFLLFIAFLFNFILLRYYWGPRFFGYLNFLRPFVLIFSAFVPYILSTHIKPKFIAVFASVAILLTIVMLSYPRNASQLIPDPFSTRVYNGVSEVKERMPNKKFILYTCSDTYRGSYNSLAYAIVFALEKNAIFDTKGTKLGLEGTCKEPQRKEAAEATKNHQKLSDIGILDFSSESEKTLADFGWQAVTFASIYDNYARWWFVEQP